VVAGSQNYIKDCGKRGEQLRMARMKTDKRRRRGGVTCMKKMRKMKKGKETKVN
jgi:hypothetical protein